MKGEKILLVEDEEAVLALNRRRLQEEGYQVFSARTLKEARALSWEYPPDLVILDVILPDGSGYDFCQEFRKISLAPILFLTCLSRDIEIVQGLKSGGDDYLTKPYSMEVLLAKVSAILRRNEMRQGIVQLPPLSIDLQRGRCTLSGEEILLSPKKLQLLAFLASHAGQEYSARELYQAIWGEDGGVSVGTIKTHISKIRAKLRLDDASPFELTFTPEKKYLFLKVRFSPEW